MKKVILVMLAVLGSTAVAVAQVGGGDIVFDNEAVGNVTFSHDFHVTQKGLQCTDCHTAIFQMKKGADKITMADINAGKFCGTCHNGEKAFKSTDCQKCHKK